MTNLGRRLRARRGQVALVTAGLLLIAPMAGRALSDTGGSTPLGGYTVFANGNGAQVLVDNPNGLAGSHPVGYIGVPEASASVETGPLGRGVATIIWPGAAVGNLGALSYQLPIPAPLEQFIKNANDPVKAQANTPGGPADASYPTGGGTDGPIVMSSHADAKTVDSQAAVAGFGTAGFIQVGSITGRGTTTLTDTLATATGISRMAGIDVLGGLLHIDALKSQATATSNGTTAKGSGSTVVSGVNVAGVPASIDNSGIHVAQSTTPIASVVGVTNQLINQVLNALNFKAELLRSTNTPKGAQNNVNAGGIVITYNIPPNLNQVLASVLHNIPQVPNVFQDATITITLAGATADVDASPGFVAGDIGSSLLPGLTGAAGTTGSSDVAGTSGTPGSPGLAATSPQLAVPSSRRSGGRAPGLLASSPIGFFDGLDPGLIALAILGAVLVAFGLKRLCTGVLDPVAGTVCPLRESS